MLILVLWIIGLFFVSRILTEEANPAYTLKMLARSTEENNRFAETELDKVSSMSSIMTELELKYLKESNHTLLENISYLEENTLNLSDSTFKTEFLNLLQEFKEHAGVVNTWGEDGQILIRNLTHAVIPEITASYKAIQDIRNAGRYANAETIQSGEDEVLGTMRDVNESIKKAIEREIIKKQKAISLSSKAVKKFVDKL